MNSQMEQCELCPRRCKADRLNGRGACGSGALVRAARAALHFGEEPCISGKEGSGTVFFSGCSLRCAFCQNQVISQEGYGRDLTARELAEVFRRLEDAGANNLNLVTGTHFAEQIAEALCIYRPKIPVLWNSSGYERPETVRMLSEFVDVWLPDLKYADPLLAEKLSGARDYPEYAFDAVGEMLDLSGNPRFDGQGHITGGVLIRHLVLPLHLKNTAAVLERIAERFGTEVWISLLFQYTPVREVPGFPELSRPLTRRERERAEEKLYSLGFHNGFVQERESAGTGMIPDFDLTGLV